MRNDIIELEIADLAATGKSVGRHEGMVVLADRGLPGEVIECQITDVKRQYALGKRIRQIRASSLWVQPRCRHFDICGGCTWQNLGYADQVSYKSRFVREALTRIGKLENPTIDPPVASLDQFDYRNKMEYSFADDEDGSTAAGLHVRGRFDAIFELEECFLQSPRSVAALKVVREKARALRIPFFNYRTGGGQLRFLVVREGKMTGDLMLNVVTFDRDFAGRDELFAAIQERVEGLTSLFQTVNSRTAHIAIGDELILAHGQPHLTEKIGHLQFQITPFSFFQTNSRQTEVLYRLIRDHAEPQSNQSILDLFCGCGTIGLYIAADVESIFGIEINPEAIEMAKVNASFNGITNAEFISGDVRKLLVELHNNGRTFDTIIADPPRAGMEATAIRRIARLNPKRIVAVSCNPATLARDLSLFGEAGYEVGRVSPVDMFPQTAHIETVVTLHPKTP
jgi:23S rRNA (uracil1939-C5)-methyltransferase